MPVSLPINYCSSQKKYRLTLLFLLFPLFFFGQTLTGLWTGALSNDSTTVRKDQLFEIALTEYRGKVYGYSRSEFIVNDTLYYIVKRVKGTIEGDVCEVVDDDIIAYNFRGRLDKGVRVTSTFKRNKADSSWYLAGTWKTNTTKKYYSVTGKVDLESEKDLTKSKLFPHLEELKLADEVAFYKENKEGIPVVTIAKPEKVKTDYFVSLNPSLPNPDIAGLAKEPLIQRPEIKTGPSESTPVTAAVNADPAKEEPDQTLVPVKKPVNDLAKTETRKINPSPVSVNPSAKPIDTGRPVPLSNEDLSREEVGEKIPDIKKPDATFAKTTTPVIQETSVSVKPSSNNNAVVLNKPPAPNTNMPNTTVSPTASNKPAAVVAKTTTPAVAKNEPARNNSVINAPSAANIQKQAQQDKNNIAATNNTNPKTSTPEIKKQETVTVATRPANTVTPVPTAVNNPGSTPASTKSIDEIIQKATTIAGRKSEFSQVVDFKSDSLELSLYDNGEIDGDTVSVYMNGDVLLSKQGLKASAIKKTIYIPPGTDQDFTLVMFAENLGKYPPNTGLLVVHDGEDIYHLRFSSDFQKSTGIVFRRKK